MKLQFTTSRGTVIKPYVLEIALNHLEEGFDYDYVINHDLRHAVPNHEEDLDEVNEVMNYLDEVMNDIWLDNLHLA